MHLLQHKVDELVSKMGGYWSPLAMLASVTEEVGELAREINALEGFKPKKPTEKTNDLGEELADALYSLICIANYYEIDLGKSFDSILSKYEKRDADRFKESNQ